MGAGLARRASDFGPALSSLDEIVRRDLAEEGPVLWPWWVLALAASTWSYLETWQNARRTVEPDLPLAISHFLAWSALSFLVGVTVAAACWLTRKGRQNLAGCGAIGLSAVLLFQSWRGVEAIYEQMGAAVGRYPALIACAALILALLILAFRVADEPSLPWVFFILVAALAGPPLLSAAGYGATLVGDADRAPPAEVAEINAGSDRKDLFVVILDGYAREDVLRDRFDIDISEFIRVLEASDFDVIDSATANYPHTWASIGSLLSLDYPIAPGPIEAGTGEDFREVLAGENTLFRSAASLGYQIVQLDNSWTFAGCGEVVDDCVPGLWMTSLDHAVMQRTPVGHLFPTLRVSPWVRGSIRQLENLASVASDQAASPRLIYAHVLIPHPPFQTREDCSTFYQSSLDGYASTSVDGGRDSRVAAYSAQISCVNSLVSDFVSALPESAVAIITADHGSDFRGQTKRPPSDWSDDDFLERFAVFTALQLPNRCEQPAETFSVVNAIRLATHCAFDSEFLPLDDRSFIVPELAGEREVIEVTEIIRRVATPGRP